MKRIIGRDGWLLLLAVATGVAMFGVVTFASAQELPPEEIVAVEEIIAATAAITAPATDGESLSGEYEFEAEFNDNDSVTNPIEWFIAYGSCDSEGELMVGNTSYFDAAHPFTFNSNEFSADVDMTDWEGGTYCFVFNPVEAGDERDVYATREFEVVPLYRISGYKYEDTNDNGERDDADELVGNWEIVAVNEETGAQVKAETNDEGYYEMFVPAGVWTVTEEEKNGWAQVRAYQGYGEEESYFMMEGEDVVPMDCTLEVYGRYAKRGPSYGNTCSFLNVKTVSTGTRVTGKSSAGKVLGVATTTTATTTPVAEENKSPVCEGMYLTTYMRMATENNVEEVKKLQIFLNALGITVSVTGVFDTATDSAVREFQKKYIEEVLSPWGLVDGTGYVYKTTRAKINNMVCPGSEVPPTV